VKPEGKKYLPGLSRYLGNTRESLIGSGRYPDPSRWISD
jgi:hypothetical protein